MEYAGAEPAMPMIVESKRPRTPLFKEWSCWSLDDVDTSAAMGTSLLFGVITFDGN